MSQNELAQPQNGAGQTTLQGAYDNDPTGAQILLDGVPNPVAVQASVAGNVFEVKDIAGNDILQVTANPDVVVAQAGVQIVDAFLNSAATVSLIFDDTFTTGGAFIGGALSTTGIITYNNSLFIQATFAEGKTYRAAAAPGFAAYTVMNILPTIENLGNFDLVQAVGINFGSNHRRITAGTSTTSSQVGLSCSPSTRATIAGATMNVTTVTGLSVAPKFSTVAGSFVNFGTIRGVHCQVPAVALFGSGTGTESMTAYYAIDVDNLGSFGGNAPVAALRSQIPSGTNQFFLLNTGGANSDHGTGHLYFDDNFGTVYGGVGTTVFDTWISWHSVVSKHRLFFSANAASLYYSNPAANRILIDINDSALGEINWNLAKFSLGAQSGANGNQVGNFVAGTRTVSVGGEWSDFLLTQAGNITVNAAMGLVAGWTVNSPSITLGTGTVSEACGLNVAGNVNQGSVGRYGVRILSNPSGATDNYPLYVVNGTSRINGLIAGDPGIEASGIDVSGTIYDSALKASAIGGGDEAQFIMHRHSTTLGPIIVGARSNNNTSAHTLVADGQDLLGIIGVGWDGADYEIAAVMRMAVDGTPGNNDMPGRIEFLTTPNGSVTAALALRIRESQRCDFYTNQALGGGANATLGAIGGSGPTAAAQAQWLEIEIGGVIHWVPAWT